MADSNHISLMLGPFEDRELEPHEYQEVAYHLARCEECTAELADYNLIGRELRTITAALPLDGFKDAVMRRIDDLPVPLSLRLWRIFGDLGEVFPSGLGMAMGAAVAAAITVIVATPYAQFALNHLAPAREVAVAAHDLAAAPVQVVESARNDVLRNVAEVGEEPEAIISRLESEIPSVAVWNEPHMGTTVIWLPDQQ
jgi:anti-sigma factor RsiW